MSEDYVNARTMLLKVQGVRTAELATLMAFLDSVENKMPPNHACPPGTYAKLIGADLEASEKRAFHVSIRVTLDHAYAGGQSARKPTPPGVIAKIWQSLGVFQEPTTPKE